MPETRVENRTETRSRLVGQGWRQAVVGGQFSIARTLGLDLNLIKGETGSKITVPATEQMYPRDKLLTGILSDGPKATVFGVKGYQLVSPDYDRGNGKKLLSRRTFFEDETSNEMWLIQPKYRAIKEVEELLTERVKRYSKFTTKGEQIVETVTEGTFDELIQNDFDGQKYPKSELVKLLVVLPMSSWDHGETRAEKVNRWYNVLPSQVGMKICAQCGEVIKNDDDVSSTVLNDLKFYMHKTCTEQLVTTCALCGQQVMKYKSIEADFIDNDGQIHHGVICDGRHPSETCECCGRRFYFNEHGWQDRPSARDLEENHTCPDCKAYSKERCPQCGRRVLPYGAKGSNDQIIGSSATRTTDSGVTYHEGCYLDALTFHQYHDSPRRLVFRGKGGDVRSDDQSAPDEPFLGMELEADRSRRSPQGFSKSRSSVVEELITKVSPDRIYCQSDGSLGPDGIETITHPMTLHEWLTDDKYKLICQTLIQNGYVSHNSSSSCGIHVHVDRKFLNGNGHIARIIFLIERFWPQVFQFTRRNEESLSSYARRIFDSDDQAAREIKNHRVDLMYNKAFENRSRYQAINLTRGSTIEFRIFKGTLNQSTVNATLEFVNNVVKMTKNMDNHDIYDVTWDKIIEYEHYDDLTAYSNARVNNPRTSDGVELTDIIKKVKDGTISGGGADNSSER